MKLKHVISWDCWVYTQNSQKLLNTQNEMQKRDGYNLIQN